MRSMVLREVGRPLELTDSPKPTPDPDELLIRVEACAVCRTDLHITLGELPSPHLPLILGHQIVGIVKETGERVGVPWLGKSCGTCPFCKQGDENLCDTPLFTGYTHNGGFAEYCTAYAPFTVPLPKDASAPHLAPLLCAGLIGYRALRKTHGAKRLGFYGFGASAHILIQIARAQGKEVFAFVRPGDTKTKTFALEKGATWAGDSTELPPTPLDAAILFAPDGSLIPKALQAVRKGGTVVCAGIHMSDIPSFPYSLLWEERHLCSVANLTRQDALDFFSLNIPFETDITTYPLEQANQALDDLRHGRFSGSAVIVL